MLPLPFVKLTVAVLTAAMSSTVPLPIATIPEFGGSLIIVPPNVSAASSNVPEEVPERLMVTEVTPLLTVRAPLVEGGRHMPGHIRQIFQIDAVH